jgi:hypothetical protein
VPPHSAVAHLEASGTDFVGEEPVAELGVAPVSVTAFATCAASSLPSLTGFASHRQ